MSVSMNRRLLTSLTVLSDYCHGCRPSSRDLDELRQHASESERNMSPDDLACLLIQRELDEYRASRGRTRVAAASAA